MSQAFVGAGHIRAIIDAEVRAFMLRYRELRQLPVELELRMRFNPQLEKSWFGSITVSFVLVESNRTVKST